MPQPAVQVELVAVGLPWSTVADVGVQRMPVVGGLNQAIRARDRRELAGETRARGRRSLDRRPVRGARPGAGRLGCGIRVEALVVDETGFVKYGTASPCV